MWLMSRSRNQTSRESPLLADGTHRSCLTSSSTSLLQWTALWHRDDQCLQGIDTTHAETLSFRPASVARNDCDLISDQHSWDDTVSSLFPLRVNVLFFINIENSDEEDSSSPLSLLSFFFFSGKSKHLQFDRLFFHVKCFVSVHLVERRRDWLVCLFKQCV